MPQKNNHVKKIKNSHLNHGKKSSAVSYGAGVPAYIIGIDEAGRGPIAGPVAVGAASVKAEIFEKEGKKMFKGIKDSKKLTEKQREKWFGKMEEWKKEGKIDFAVSYESPQTIDAIGIVKSIKRALGNSIKKLAIKPDNASVLLDGGLKAPEAYKNQKTIIRGDEKEPIIALASIAAKVLRDSIMVKLGKKYPKYGFETHKGYGTKFHYKNLEKHGPFSPHRKSFLKSFFE